MMDFITIIPLSKNEHNVHRYYGRNGTVKYGNIHKVMKHHYDGIYDDDDICCIIF